MYRLLINIPDLIDAYVYAPGRISQDEMVNKLDW